MVVPDIICEAAGQTNKQTGNPTTSFKIDDDNVVAGIFLRVWLAMKSGCGLVHIWRATTGRCGDKASCS